MHEKMNVLVLDTSTERLAIGLLLRSGAVYTKATSGAQKHGRDLIPGIAELLALGEIEARKIDAIGVGLGPGSYTGLRVGVMAAKTMAYITGAALLGMDSLLAVAWNAPGDAMRVSVVADAQRRDLYTAEFIRDAPGEPLRTTCASQIEPLESWARRLEPGTFVIGPGLARPHIKECVASLNLVGETENNYPDGQRLIEVFHREWSTGRRENMWTLEPRYLRGSAAEEKREGRRTSSE